MKPLVLLGDLSRFDSSVVHKAIAGRLERVDGGTLSEPIDGVYMTWNARCKPGLRKVFRNVIPAGARLINEDYDSDKRNVEQHHQAVFGYSPRVDPLGFVGAGVVKSRINARHDGRVVQFPIEAADHPRRVYQRLIDNRCDADLVEDIRLDVLLGQTVVCYLKQRPIATRFSNANSSAVRVDVEDVLSAAEVATILRFCAHIGLDYGGLDVLRDRGSGLIYIVDANNTPHGPPSELSAVDRAEALRLVGDAFVALVSEQSDAA